MLVYNKISDFGKQRLCYHKFLGIEIYRFCRHGIDIIWNQDIIAFAPYYVLGFEK